jgi:hypothetical protein
MQNNFRITFINNKKILEYKDEDIKIFFTTKDFGSFSTNDAEGYKKLFQEINYEDNTMVLSDQIHDNKVEIIKKSEKEIMKLKETDGMVTNLSKTTLCTVYADCVPLFFYDKTKKVIASSHSGWKGTAKNIAKETIDKMKTNCGCKPEDIKCLIGPSISQKNYEVDEKVFQAIKNVAHTEKIAIRQGEKYLLDLWQANKILVEREGIPTENIIISGFCTYEFSELFYSYRREGQNAGRMTGLITVL